LDLLQSSEPCGKAERCWAPAATMGSAAPAPGGGGAQAEWRLRPGAGGACARTSASRPPAPARAPRGPPQPSGCRPARAAARRSCPTGRAGGLPPRPWCQAPQTAQQLLPAWRRRWRRSCCGGGGGRPPTWSLPAACELPASWTAGGNTRGAPRDLRAGTGSSSPCGDEGDACGTRPGVGLGRCRRFRSPASAHTLADGRAAAAGGARWEHARGARGCDCAETPGSACRWHLHCARCIGIHGRKPHWPRGNPMPFHDAGGRGSHTAYLIDVAVHHH
jgi:hypothetical protein